MKAQPSLLHILQHIVTRIQHSYMQPTMFTTWDTWRTEAGNAYGSLFLATRSLKRSMVKPYWSIFVDDRGPRSLRIQDPRNTTLLCIEYLTTIISSRTPTMLTPALCPSFAPNILAMP